MKITDIPKYHEFMHPVLAVLDKLGGASATSELNDEVIKFTKLSDEAVEFPYPSGSGLVVPDRISWARTYLKKAGLIESQGRGIWAITSAGREAMSWSAAELKKTAENAEYRMRPDKAPNSKANAPQQEQSTGENAEFLDWQDELLTKLKGMEPSAFERLAQRLLREAGFVKVEVTGKSGDGGIDGTGIMQLSLMSFHVLFQ